MFQAIGLSSKPPDGAPDASQPQQKGSLLALKTVHTGGIKLGNSTELDRKKLWISLGSLADSIVVIHPSDRPPSGSRIFRANRFHRSRTDTKRSANCASIIPLVARVFHSRLAQWARGPSGACGLRAVNVCLGTQLHPARKKPGAPGEPGSPSDSREAGYCWRASVEA